VDQLKIGGLPIIFGDASQPVILEAAHVEKANFLLVTTPATQVAQAVVRQAKKLHPDLHVVTRAHSFDQLKEFPDKGIYHVVQPKFETGLEFTRQALLHLDFPVDRIQQFTDDIRHERYRPLYDMQTEYKSVAQLQSSSRLFQLTWITLHPGSPLTGKTIGQSNT